MYHTRAYLFFGTITSSFPNCTKSASFLIHIYPILHSVMVYQEAKFRNRHVPKKRESLAESKQDFKNRVGSLLEMSKQHLNNNDEPASPSPSVVEGEQEQKPRVKKEPVPNVKMSLGRTIVIKRDTPVNVPMISAYRKWLRAEQRMANLLADTTPSKTFMPMRLAAMAGAEEYVCGVIVFSFLKPVFFFKVCFNIFF